MEGMIKTGQTFQKDPDIGYDKTQSKERMVKVRHTEDKTPLKVFYDKVITI